MTSHNVFFGTTEFELAADGRCIVLLREYLSDRFKSETKKKQTKKKTNKQSCNSMYLSSTLGITRHILHDCVHKVWKNDANRKLFNTSLNFDAVKQHKERNVTACRPIFKHNAGCAVTARFEVWFGLFALFHRMLRSQSQKVSGKLRRLLYKTT